MDSHHVNDILISSLEIETRVDELVHEIAKSTSTDNLVLVGVLRGSFMFIADLVRDFNNHGLHPRIDFMTLESYGAGTTSNGNVRVTKDIHVDVTGADVLIIDDILDSGRTLSFAVKHLNNKGAGSVKTCTLLDKPSQRVIDISSDFNGFSIEDIFVVGYGLDYDSYYRELPHIAKVTFTN